MGDAMIKLKGPLQMWRYPLLARVITPMIELGGEMSYCWFCGRDFVDLLAAFCETCRTFKCPFCGGCFCDLNERAKQALDAEMVTLGLWEPSSNPPKRKKKSVARERLELEWATVYPHLTWDEFILLKGRR